MASYRKATNEMVTCPYDPAHRMLQSRLQMHITKCKLNHLDKEMDVCPFNATHQLEKGLMKDHLTKCSDRLPLDKKLSSAMDKNNLYKGRTAVPCYQQPTPPCDEVWDTSIFPSAGYIPQTAPPKDGIVQDLGSMKPAERKDFYRQLHSMNSSNDKVGSETRVKHTQEPLRQPRQKHEDLLTKNVLNNSSSANVGVGRGHVKADSRRIAADIFRQPKSYRQVVEGMITPNVGIGRGRIKPEMLSEEYRQNFPALGIVRGENNAIPSSADIPVAED